MEIQPINVYFIGGSHAKRIFNQMLTYRDEEIKQTCPLLTDIKELENISKSTSYDPDDFIKNFPHCYQLALKYADDNKMSIQDYLLSTYDPDRYQNEIFQRNKKNILLIK